ncbi:MAG: family 43 glycosylhydrolase [Verrucomicrobiota bacterium]
MNSFFLALILIVPAVATAAEPPFTWTNPLPFQYTEGQTEARREVRDPCIIRDGDTWYLVHTMWPFANREEKKLELPNNGSSPGIALYQSKDLKDWSFVNWLVKSSDLPENSPYKHRFWAPEIHKLNGKFHLVFTADNWLKKEVNPHREFASAGWAFVGVADKITGPYQHITGIPDGACDTTLFADDKGSTFAVMPKHDLFIRPIDLTGLDKGVVRWLGPEKKILNCDSSDTDLTLSPAYLEGPWVEKIGARYHLFYAELFKEGGYWTGVASADSPLGPWIKDRRGKIFPGGHLAVFDGPDGRKWVSYRIEHRNESRGLLAIDPVEVDAAGKVRVLGPSPE